MAHTGETSEDRGNEGIDMMIDIKVKTMDSQTHNLRISNLRRVRNLKEDITLLIGMPIEQQRLLYRGKHLLDDQVISSCNVQHGDTLHLVCNISGARHSAGTDGTSSDIHRDLERDRQQNLINLYDPRVPQRIRQIILTMLDYVGRVVMQVHMRQVAIQRNFQYDLYLARLRQRGHMDVDGNLWSQLDDLPEYIPVEFNTTTPGATIENVTENMGTGISSGPSTVEYRSAHESSFEPPDEDNSDFSSAS